jgi:cell wall-associated NlpC family hydrolase
MRSRQDALEYERSRQDALEYERSRQDALEYERSRQDALEYERSLLLVIIIAGLTLAIAAGCGPTLEPTADGNDSTGIEGDPGEDSEGDVGDDTLSDGPIVAADDTIPAVSDTPETLAAATKARTTANVNLRKSASTSAAVLAVIPSGSIVDLVTSSPTSGFYNVRYNGVTGFAHSNYLTPISDDDGSSGGTTGAVDLEGPASPANAIARAKAAVGFSYYWGGGAWLASGATSSNRGSCSGNCPSCSHSGKYGADCSGLVAKAWQFGTKALSVNSHPFSTSDFNSDVSGKWSTVSRGSLRAGDALVHRSGGSGHIVIYEKGDGWGSPTVYECRGCSYGCVHNARSFSGYHGIRRAGF